MKILTLNVWRNTKLFFKDKGLFFTSLITPLILLVLYATFLANVYKSSFTPYFAGLNVKEQLIDSCVAGQLISSLLAVSCITVSFCSNMLMVQDKISGARKDMLLTPVRRSNLALAYYISSTLSTLIICYVALSACLIYTAFVGWYFTFSDVLKLILDVFILTSFGTAFSSIINYFLSSQGQISAVGSIVSSCYGFICGAYMPISSFSTGLQNVLSFLPGTYGTSLIKEHALRGAFEKLVQAGVSEQEILKMKEAIDVNLYFSGDLVNEGVKYAVIIGAVIVSVIIYVFINLKRKSKKELYKREKK